MKITAARNSGRTLYCQCGQSVETADWMLLVQRDEAPHRGVVHCVVCGVRALGHDCADETIHGKVATSLAEAVLARMSRS